MPYRIVLEKENFKFSASHFTIFSSDRAEALHGHNYYVKIELLFARVSADLGMAFDFNFIKPLVRAILHELDEKVLLASKSPYLKIKSSGANYEIGFAKKNYSLPIEDVCALDLVNITSEELARYIAEKLVPQLKGHASMIKNLQKITAGVEETRGQIAYFSVDDFSGNDKP